MKRLQLLREKVKGIMKIYNTKDTKILTDVDAYNITSIKSFKLTPNKEFTSGANEY